MNSKRFVGKIPEISYLSKFEQEAVIEKARYEAFVHLGLSGRAATYLIVCLALGFLIAVLPIFIFGFSTIIGSLFLMAGILFAILFYQKLYLGLLIRGLKNVGESNHA